MVKESERLTRLINDILDLSRIESGRMEWHLSTCDPKEIVDDALAATSGLFKEKGIALEPEFASDLPRITVDRDRLMQVVINLLSNAAKFAQTGRRPGQGAPDRARTTASRSASRTTARASLRTRARRCSIGSTSWAATR